MRDITQQVQAGRVSIAGGAAQHDERCEEGAAATPAMLSAGFLRRSEAFLDRQESGEAYRRSKNPYRVMARKRLHQRERKRDTGLSNTAYLAATSGTQKLTVKITPARVKFTVSDPLADMDSSTRPPSGGRGVVREFSEGARDRLADRAAELQVMGHEPQVMQTLTCPGEWESVYIGKDEPAGRIFKQHQEAFRKRLDRKLEKLGIPSWSALWFLEFQARGAPHLHIIIFGCVISSKQRAALRSWAGRAWAAVVGHPDKQEREKHRKAGTQTAKMKKKHFGYAMKYASKMEQKTVPEGFHGVGRFWGVWNCKKETPLEVELDYSRLNEQERDFVYRLVVQTLAQVIPHSPGFFQSRIDRIYRALHQGIKHKTGFSVYGESASQTAKSFLSA